MLHFNLRMEMQPLFKMSEKERKRKCFLSVPIYASNLQPAVYLRQLLFLFKYQEKRFARILDKIQKCGKVAVLRQYPLLWSLISFEGLARLFEELLLLHVAENIMEIAPEYFYGN